MAGVLVASEKVLVVVGPTAAGKTRLAVALARRSNGEIISADSRQVYRGMDIGTGKDLDDYVVKIRSSKPEARSYRVPYHLIDVCSPKRQFTVAEYQRRAYRAIEDILRRGKLPIICGGTGLYVDSVVDGHQFPQIRNSSPPMRDPAILENNKMGAGQSAIRQLRQKLGRLSLPQLLARLQRVDPVTYGVMDRKNRRRVERALEIYYQTGRPKSAQLEKVAPPYKFLTLGVKLPKAVLYRRIKRRLTQRLRQGLASEVRRLHRQGVSWRRLDSFGLEYRWVSRHLRGQVDQKTMEVNLLRDIQQFARRQMVWWKRNPKITWIATPAQAAGLVRIFLQV